MFKWFKRKKTKSKMDDETLKAFEDFSLGLDYDAAFIWGERVRHEIDKKF